MKIGDEVIVTNTIVPYLAIITEIIYDESQVVPTPIAVRVDDKYTSYVVDIDNIICEPKWEEKND